MKPLVIYNINNLRLLSQIKIKLNSLINSSLQVVYNKRSNYTTSSHTNFNFFKKVRLISSLKDIRVGARGINYNKHSSNNSTLSLSSSFKKSVSEMGKLTHFLNFAFSSSIKFLCLSSQEFQKLTHNLNKNNSNQLHPWSESNALQSVKALKQFSNKLMSSIALYKPSFLILANSYSFLRFISQADKSGLFLVGLYSTHSTSRSLSLGVLANTESVTSNLVFIRLVVYLYQQQLKLKF